MRAFELLVIPAFVIPAVVMVTQPLPHAITTHQSQSVTNQHIADNFITDALEMLYSP